MSSNICTFLFLMSNYAFFCHSFQLKMIADRPLKPQPTWGVKDKKPDTYILDVVSVLGRFKDRTDFYSGSEFERPEEGLLTKERFYNKLKDRRFEDWPLDEDGNLVGTSGLSESEIENLRERLQSALSENGIEAVFTSFAKGAGNGVVYPGQVDFEMGKWLSSNRIFSLEKFENTLFWGRVNVFIGWFLYIGLQFGGIYVVFFVPIMSHFFPGKLLLYLKYRIIIMFLIFIDVDYYPVQTFLHTSEWGK